MRMRLILPVVLLGFAFKGYLYNQLGAENYAARRRGFGRRQHRRTGRCGADAARSGDPLGGRPIRDPAELIPRRGPDGPRCGQQEGLPIDREALCVRQGRFGP